jgi:hypothetical protein
VLGLQLPGAVMLDGDADQPALPRFGQQPVHAGAVQPQPCRGLLLVEARHIIEPCRSHDQRVIRLMGQVDGQGD